MANHIRVARPLKRQGFWYLVRRVPARFSDIDTREMLVRSTGIRVSDDPRAIVARQRVRELDEELLQNWHTMKDGGGLVHGDAVTDANKRFGQHSNQLYSNEYHCSNARALNIPHGAERGPLISQMLNLFIDAQTSCLQKKSQRQFAKWRKECLSALRQFMKVIGADKPIQELTRADARSYRQYLERRVTIGRIEIETANKYLGRIAVMYRTINNYQQLDLPDIFQRLGIPGGVRKQRVAFEIEFARSALFASGALATLNEEARGIFYVVAETGMRPSEVCALTRETIKLDHAIPHLQVRPYDRELKTNESWRDIPLVGAALDVMKRFPSGFSNYKGNSAKLSAAVNKYLREHGLLVEEGQSFYSLRHLFEDRLTEVEAPEKVVASLMGHKWHRPRYGKGPTLTLKLKWMSRIVFDASWIARQP